MSNADAEDQPQEQQTTTPPPEEAPQAASSNQEEETEEAPVGMKELEVEEEGEEVGGTDAAASSPNTGDQKKSSKNEENKEEDEGTPFTPTRKSRRAKEGKNGELDDTSRSMSPTQRAMAERKAAKPITKGRQSIGGGFWIGSSVGFAQLEAGTKDLRSAKFRHDRALKQIKDEHHLTSHGLPVLECSSHVQRAGNSNKMRRLLYSKRVDDENMQLVERLYQVKPSVSSARTYAEAEKQRMKYVRMHLTVKDGHNGNGTTHGQRRPGHGQKLDPISDDERLDREAYWNDDVRVPPKRSVGTLMDPLEEEEADEQHQEGRSQFEQQQQHQENGGGDSSSKTPMKPKKTPLGDEDDGSRNATHRNRKPTNQEELQRKSDVRNRRAWAETPPPSLPPPVESKPIPKPPSLAQALEGLPKGARRYGPKPNNNAGVKSRLMNGTPQASTAAKQQVSPSRSASQKKRKVAEEATPPPQQNKDFAPYTGQPPAKTDAKAEKEESGENKEEEEEKEEPKEESKTAELKEEKEEEAAAETPPEDEDDADVVKVTDAKADDARVKEEPTQEEEVATKPQENSTAAAEEDPPANTKKKKNSKECKQCQKPITDDFVEYSSPDSDEVWPLHDGECADIFQQQHAPKCVRCKLAIYGDNAEGSVEIDGKPYHQKCADEMDAERLAANRVICQQCSKPIEGDFLELTIPGEPGTEDITVSVHKGECAENLQRETAPKCEHCTNPIYGESAEGAVEIDGHPYHQKCVDEMDAAAAEKAADDERNKKKKTPTPPPPVEKTPTPPLGEEDKEDAKEKAGDPPLMDDPDDDEPAREEVGLCTWCKKMIYDDEDFQEGDDDLKLHPHCVEPWEEDQAPKCGYCGKPIMESFTELKSATTGETVNCHDECVQLYNQKHRPMCTKCGEQVLDSEGVTTLDEKPYHERCAEEVHAAEES